MAVSQAAALLIRTALMTQAHEDRGRSTESAKIVRNEGAALDLFARQARNWLILSRLIELQLKSQSPTHLCRIQIRTRALGKFRLKSPSAPGRVGLRFWQFSF